MGGFFLFLSLLLLSPTRASAKLANDCRAIYRQIAFDLEHKQEFPNLFLPENLRAPHLAPGALRAALKESRAATEAALNTLFNRLVVPVYLPGQSEPVAKRFFPLARMIARGVDPEARVAPSGGVIRSALGFLYEEMLRESERNPGFSAVEFLGKIAKGEHRIFDKNGNVMAFDLRGVGSDFDILLDADPLYFGRINEQISALFRKEGTSLEKSTDPNDMNKALFTIADLKPMHEQTTRSVRQGGASLDLLMFDLETKSLIEPPEVSGIVDDFLQGYYRYLPPLPGQKREAAMVTTMRGPRSLVEMPFLRLRPEGQAELNRELRAILQGIEQHAAYPGDKAIEQINKLRRNARLSMGNNAIQRAPANTTLGLLRSIAEALEKQRELQLLKFPSELRFNSYTARYKLGAERAKLAEDLPADLRRFLIRGDDFLAQHTDEGFIYHGTTGQGALGALRGGFRQSDYETGLHRGTFASADPNLARGYATARSERQGGVGYVLKLNPRTDAPITALDTSSPALLRSPGYRRILNEAKANGLEVSDWLAKRYGIDFTVLTDSGTLLIKNTEALDHVTLPSLVRDTVDSLNKGFHRADADFSLLIAERARLEQSKPLFRALDIEVGQVPTIEEFCEQGVKSIVSGKDPVRMLKTFEELPESYQARLGPQDFGGKSVAERLAEAMTEDFELTWDVFARGQGYGYLQAKQDPQWIAQLGRAAEKLVTKTNDPSLPPEQSYRYLHSLASIVSNNAGQLRASEYAGMLDERVFAAIRARAAEQPTLFPDIQEIDETFSRLLQRKLELTSTAIAKRIETLRTVKSVQERLKALRQLQWSMNIPLGLGEHPEVVAEMKKLIPLLQRDEDLLSQDAPIILDAIGMHAGFPADLAAKALLQRSLDAALRAAPDAASFRREPQWLLMAAMNAMLRKPELQTPKLLESFREAHRRYHFDVKWPGAWPALKKTLEL